MVELKVYNLDLIFQALADPTRRAIVRNLSSREKVITEIATPFKMSLAAVSKHIKVLERAKLIHRRKEGCFSYISLNAEAMMNANQWTEYYRKFWNVRLKSLKKLMEDNQ